MDQVLYKVDQQIATVTINRPEVLNCFDYETLQKLGHIVDDIQHSQDIRVVIITGAGDKAFSAGADLKERKQLTESEVRRNVKTIRDVFNQVSQLPQPTIAAVNGYAFGGGFELMLACDFSIAVKNTKMGLTETSWGIIPGAGGTQRLPHLIGPMKAKELILTAKKISSEEAINLGIVLDVVEKDYLLKRTNQLATDILKSAPVAIKQAKFAIDQGMNTDIQTGLEIESKAYELTINTFDRKEALQAFHEKREPKFIGK